MCEFNPFQYRAIAVDSRQKTDTDFPFLHPRNPS